MSRTVLRTPLRDRDILLVALLVAAITVNLVGFGAADRGAASYWQAIHRYDTSSFAELGMTENRHHFSLVFGLQRALAELAPGSTVILLEPGPDLAARFYGVGDVESVRINDAEALDTMLASFDPGPFIVASAEGGRAGLGRLRAPWGIALDEPDPRPTDLRDATEFLPAIVAADRQGEARGDPREFVLVKWPDPDIPARFAFRLVLVETSLLPPEVREVVSS